MGITFFVMTVEFALPLRRISVLLLQAEGDTKWQKTS
jgi:hypothetical protein